MQERFGYAYDKAWNLYQRTNNALVQTFNVNSLNELTMTTNKGKLTVAGTATEYSGNSPYVNDPGVTSVTVNGLAADLYEDGTFAATNFTLANGDNSFTAIAQDNEGRWSTNSVTVNLPATNNYSYDPNGNLLSDGTRYFAYDDENQLISVTVSNAWRSEFVYDGLLRRRISREYTWSSGSWILTSETRYVYDAQLVIQERDANNLPLVSYTRGNDLSGTFQGAGGIGGLLARTDNGLLIAGSTSAHAYYFFDGNGNVMGLVNSNGVVVASYTYDPFGNMLAMSGPMAVANTYRFSSKEWNEHAGLYYYGFRFYDPNLQRWPNRDPIGEEGGINLYEFAANDPIVWFDLYGLCGNLTIYSSGTSGLGNHSWISYTPDNGKTTTYGTWRAGDGSPGTGPGLNVNREQAYQHNADATRTEHLNDKQEALLNNMIADYKNAGDRGWAYGSPCSSFAAKAWNKATGEHLSPFWGPISNPTSLTHSITSANGGTPNGTATPGTGNSLGNSSASTGNSSSAASGNSSVTPSGNSLQGSGSL